MKTKLYQTIARSINVLENVKKGTVAGQNARNFLDIHAQRIANAEKYLPDGSGFDNGSHVNLSESTPERLIINSSYHHMSNNGYYVAWSHFKIIVKPSLAFGFTVDIRGEGKQPRQFYENKDFFVDVFETCLDGERTC